MTDVIVTGASRGLGRAIALAFARDGARVGLVARAAAQLTALAEETGGVALAADVRDPDALAGIAQRFGTPDAVVLAAGIPGPTAPLWEVSPEDWEETVGANLTGVYLTCRAFLPGMVARGRGSIVVIGSMTGKRPLPGRTPYAASKTALIGLVRTLAWDAGPHGVRVNMVSPGPIAGERLERVIEAQGPGARERFLAASPLAAFADPVDVVAAVRFLCSDVAITGEDLNVSAGSVMYGMTEHGVVIVGGGPAGMMLAAELALAKADVAIVERRPDHVLADSRAGGIHSRTIEVLDQRGVVDRFLAEGQPIQAATFGTTVMDMSDFPTRHPYSLAIFQNKFERIMAAWIAELPVRIYHACDVTGFAQDETGVDVRLTGGEPLRARYLVGCDGGRSMVRKTAGIEFPGWDATRSNLIAEVELTEEPPPGVRHDAAGVHGLHRLEDGKTYRVVTTEQQPSSGSEPTLRELSEALSAVYGTDFGIHNATWISRFTDMTRQAAAYRAGRVLLAGDAAHVHYPAGGQGLSLGVQDAVNLGWKLARVVDGTAPERLLDTYHAERHPVAARALRYTMAQTTLQRHEERVKAVVEVVSELASMDEPRKLLAGRISGLDIHYDLGEGHPLLGRRMPDLDLDTADGPLRVFELLHDARPLLLDLGQPGDLDVAPWADRVQLVRARYDGEWELPVLGTVSAPTAVLIRPDGYVAWVGEGTDAGVTDAVTTWFGPVNTRS